MIKVAVISDLHGNMEALTSVLSEIVRNNVDKILILGDFALVGPEPNVVISYIRELSKTFDITAIQGNTDLMILNDIDENMPPIFQNAIKYSQDNISDINKDFLRNLPATLSIKIGNTQMLLVHGSPRKNDENIFPNKDIDSIKEIIAGVEENLILCGHTHLPCGYQVDKKTVVNVGSVGRPFTGDNKACYVLLEISEENKDTFTVTHKFVDFDVENASKKIRAQKFEGADIIADLLLKSSAN